jgi:hypothetical protein
MINFYVDVPDLGKNPNRMIFEGDYDKTFLEGEFADFQGAPRAFKK